MIELRWLALALALVVVPAKAAMYKWVDEQGNVHYTQSRPTGVEAREIKAPSPAPASAPAEEPSPDEEAEENLPPPPPPTADLEEERRNQAIRKENCENARKNLEIYTRHRRILVDGEVMVLSDDERARRLKEAQEHIKQFCP